MTQKTLSVSTHLQWSYQQIHKAPHYGSITSSQPSTEEGGGQGAATHSQRRGRTRLERRTQRSNKLSLYVHNRRPRAADVGLQGVAGAMWCDDEVCCRNRQC
jgi:hypothetical protein